MGIFEEAERDAALRAHIRQLLYAYATEHLTINHVEFTEQAVAELLSESLRPCPMTNSFSIRLPEQPFDVLARLYSLHSLDPSTFDETPSIPPGAIQYLRKSLAKINPGKAAKSHSQHAVESNDYECYTPDERFESILSRRARKETPSPGSNASRTSLDTTHNTFLISAQVNTLIPLPVPPVEEPANTIHVDSVLNATYGLSKETTPKVRDLLRSIIALSQPRPTYFDRYLDPRTRPDSPLLFRPTSLLDPGPEFTPIFPRRRMPHNELAKVSRAPKPTSKPGLFTNRPDKPAAVALEPLRSAAQLGTKLTLVKTEEEDEEAELRRESMQLVDGWETYHSSPIQALTIRLGRSSSNPSSVATPHSSQEEVDQLDFDWTISSPNTELTPIKLLKDFRMDLPALPRSERIGLGGTATKGKPKRIGAKQSYTALIFESVVQKKTSYIDAHPTVHIPETPMRRPKDQSGRAGDNPSPLPPKSSSKSTSGLSTSILGQPTTSLLEGDGGTGFANAGIGVDSFESDLNTIPGFRDLREEDPKALIMKEKLNVKGDGKGLLMEVPNLPPPNDHSPNNDVLFLAKRMSEYILPLGAKLLGGNAVPMNNGLKTYQFLRKAKGVQSITLELSWVPFSVSDPLPTNEEMLGVDTTDYIDNHLGFVRAFERMGMTKERGLEKANELIRRVSETCEVGASDQHSQSQLAHERIWSEWSDRSDRANEKIVGEVSEDSKLWKMDAIILSREERRRLTGLESGHSGMKGKISDSASEEQQEKYLDADGRVEDTMDGDDQRQSLSAPSADTIMNSESPSLSPLASVPPSGSAYPAASHCASGLSPASVLPPALDFILATQAGETGDSQGQEYMLPQIETEFGIPIDLPIVGECRDDSLLDGNKDFGCDFGILPCNEDGYGFGFGYDEGFDSDKENRDPSLPAQNYAGGSALTPPRNVRGMGDWMGHDDASLPSRYAAEEVEGDHNRPAKRRRLDGWGAQHEHEEYSQDAEGRSSYRRLDGCEQEQEQSIADSGIGFMDHSLSGFLPAHTRDGDGPDDSRFRYMVEMGPCSNVTRMDDHAPRMELDHPVEEGLGVLHDTNRGKANVLRPLPVQYKDSDIAPIESQTVIDTQSPLLDHACDLQLSLVVRGAPTFPHLQIPSDLTFHDHPSGIADFVKLRAKKLRTPSPALNLPSTIDDSISEDCHGDRNVAAASRTAPDSLFDKNTLRLPPVEDRMLPTSAHWYIASMNLLQKQALVRSLRSESCGIGLVERGYLEGVDLIIDPNTAVIFFNLLSLPAEIDPLTKRLCSHSWRYDTILVVFEAFAPSLALKPESNASQSKALRAYTPPVIKAVRKLRRDLALAEAYDNKRAECQVLIAFADTVKEAAMYARLVGNDAERRDNDGMIWGDRGWLEEEAEDEESLATAEYMNPFAACVVLCQVNIDEFLGMGSEERIRRFRLHVGHYRITKLNEVISHGVQASVQHGATLWR
ncbi:hypothetical protein GYMLUDRAFT_261288 [Collybiopsis luxurians FD-317 M1]|uniref:Unplaced genomic scaffold GYMLUscaffold_26, whole genome shotgun sequence n=1 Tax=Collybiopsis luxurians FD-317 M1 TaxID=944289 RepID=A0A0D0CX13_9AGAR|nr:hypothetical protein GYMLUDRAFT_261288 [Collybiopsis luxurians FD-317 M1]